MNALYRILRILFLALYWRVRLCLVYRRAMRLHDDGPIHYNCRCTVQKTPGGEE